MRPHYLYLTKPEWAEAWIKGGPVPLSPASTYLSSERKATLTPDELRQRTVVSGGGRAVQVAEQVFPGGQVYMTNCAVVVGDEPPMHVGFAHTSAEDSLILCFSLSLSKAIMQRLEKTCVVRITDLEPLGQAIDAQLGVTGRYEEIIYTRGPDRGHQFKGWEDRWQVEARLFWQPEPIVPVEVLIPPGTAEFVDLSEVPDTQLGSWDHNADWYDRRRGYFAPPEFPERQGLTTVSSIAPLTRADRRRLMRAERKRRPRGT